jgi:hypothetical protein
VPAWAVTESQYCEKLDADSKILIEAFKIAAADAITADGAGTTEIMRRTGKPKTAVWRWQERFMRAGVDGLLRDKTRPSRIPPLPAETAERVVALTLAYIDQQDEKLAFRPADLVQRDEVAGYPTDFSAMPLKWIGKLSKRGEQLTLAVIREHAPDLLPPDWEDRMK